MTSSLTSWADHVLLAGDDVAVPSSLSRDPVRTEVDTVGSG